MRAEPESLLTVRDLGTRYGLTEAAVAELAKRGELPGFKVGKAWRFRPSAIEKWERQREREAAS
jgi:excisionase family DNA binding protein